MIVVFHFDFYSCVVKRERVYSLIHFARAFNAVDEQGLENIETLVTVECNRDGIADLVGRFIESRGTVGGLNIRSYFLIAQKSAERIGHTEVRHGIGKVCVPTVGTDSVNRIAVRVGKVCFVLFKQRVFRRVIEVIGQFVVRSLLLDEINSIAHQRVRNLNPTLVCRRYGKFTVHHIAERDEDTPLLHRSEFQRTAIGPELYSGIIIACCRKHCDTESAVVAAIDHGNHFLVRELDFGSYKRIAGYRVNLNSRTVICRSGRH